MDEQPAQSQPGPQPHFLQMPDQHGGGDGSHVRAARGRVQPAAALLLVFLAPVMAELLSSSSPPAEFFQPFAIVFMTIGYGFAAVLLREFAVRQQLGFWGRIVLSLCMGLAIEGIICKSFFSPEWPDFSFPTGYDRLFGVNWCWAALLLVFHATQSFLLPWLATDLVLPQYRNAPSLSRKAMYWLAGTWAAAALFAFLAFPMNQTTKAIYHPGVLGTLLAWGGCLALPWLALRLDRWQKARAAGQPPHTRSGRLPSPRILGWMAGLCVPVLQFFGPSIIVERLHWPAYLLFVLILAFVAAALWFCSQLMGRLSLQHSFALLAGTQTFWVIADLIAQGDNAKRPDNTDGMGIVAVAVCVGIVGLSALLKSRQRRQLRASAA